jgi:hypothetical protein
MAVSARKVYLDSPSRAGIDRTIFTGMADRIATIVTSFGGTAAIQLVGVNRGIQRLVLTVIPA